MAEIDYKDEVKKVYPFAFSYSFGIVTEEFIKIVEKENGRDLSEPMSTEPLAWENAWSGLIKKESDDARALLTDPFIQDPKLYTRKQVEQARDEILDGCVPTDFIHAEFIQCTFQKLLGEQG